MGNKTMTSAMANKMLRKLNDEKDYLLQLEQSASVYIEAEGTEAYIPEYDHKDVSSKISDFDNKVCILKHAINKMDTETSITVNIKGVSTTMRIDVALVKMAQLNRRADTLNIMRKRLPKSRRQNGYGGDNNLVEYICVNYDVDEVKGEYDDLMDIIAEMESQIDYINQTVELKFEEEL